MTDKMKVANAFGLAMAILWVVCAGFIWLLPDLSWLITGWWMHGMDLSAMGSWNITFDNFFWGGVTAIISAWVTGWVLGWSWEKVGGKTK